MGLEVAIYIKREGRGREGRREGGIEGGKKEEKGRWRKSCTATEDHLPL